MPRPSRAPLTGGQLLLALVAAVLVTAVLPPGAAWWLNRHRVQQTMERARVGAEAVRSHADARQLDRVNAAVVCGPGRIPKAGGASDDWVRETVIAPALFGAGMPTDAWGQCFLMNVEAWKSGGHVWILSAGPNGRVDTPLGAGTVQGDDIAVVVK